jgi:putative ABC transport system ATP-binding protein
MLIVKNGTNIESMSIPLIQIRRLHKAYDEAGRRHTVLEDVNLDIEQGEFFVLLEKSGSGKSTLLNLMSGIERADGGEVIIGGTNVTALGESRRKSETLGRVLLDRVGLTNRTDSFPDQLSSGEQQRVAITPALVHEPTGVLADEPRGNLDEETGRTVLQLLLELTRDAGKTLIMATHNPEIVPLADSVYRIHDGQLLITSENTLKLHSPS